MRVAGSPRAAGWTSSDNMSLIAHAVRAQLVEAKSEVEPKLVFKLSGFALVRHGVDVVAEAEELVFCPPRRPAARPVEDTSDLNKGKLASLRLVERALSGRLRARASAVPRLLRIARLLLLLSRAGARRSAHQWGGWLLRRSLSRLARLGCICECHHICWSSGGAIEQDEFECVSPASEDAPDKESSRRPATRLRPAHGAPLLPRAPVSLDASSSKTKQHQRPSPLQPRREAPRIHTTPSQSRHSILDAQ